MATSYFINASELDRQRRVNEQLKEALDSRIAIEQAERGPGRAYQDLSAGHVGVCGLDRAVQPGQVFGFLGPSGTGKTPPCAT
jgi:hypothetical protein